MAYQPRAVAVAALWSALILAGCGDDGTSADTEDSDPSASGFTESDTMTSGGPDSQTGTGTGDPSSTDTMGSGYDTLGEGDMRGILTFALYPADPVTNEDLVGMAGAWRNVDDELTEVDDFFALQGLDTAFPLPPTDADTLEQNGLLVAFDWGAPGDWLLAGNAMKLRVTGDTEDTQPQACLMYRGGEPTIEIPPQSGNFVPNYPVYAATNSTLQPEGCAPDPATWLEDTEYDIVLYGGDLFEDNSLAGQVHTPPGFEVISPDISVFQEPVDSTNDLTITWTSNGSPDDRVIIRGWDMFGRMFTANAADDGQYTISASDLQELDLGPMTLTIARENIEEVPFTDGLVKVVTRYERWGYLDLF